MDTFMDKLAHRLNAQEMIKANTSAEAAETTRLKEQNKVYEALMEKTQESSAQSALQVAESVQKVEQNALQVAESVQKVEQNAIRTEELIDAALAKIAEFQKEEQDTSELTALLEALKKVQDEKFEGLSDHVHKENVKVYRNVQAVVVEEAAKSNDLSAKKLSSISRKVTFVLILSLLSMLVSAAGLAFQILTYLNII